MGRIWYCFGLSIVSWFVLASRVASAGPSLVEVHTAAPNVLVVVLADAAAVRDDGREGDPSAFSVNQTLTSWGVEDGSTSVAISAIHRYTVPYDEERKDDTKGTYVVTVHHRIYLVLGQSLQEGHSYAVTLPAGYGGPPSLTFSSTSTYC
jgi:hypothetical protein